MNDQKGKASRTINGRAAAWMLAAFGLLVAGLAGGALFHAGKADLGWTVPLAGFAAYLYAFRRGMVLWNPGIDRSWRAVRGTRPDPPVPKGWDPDATVPVLRSDASEPSNSPLRVVR